MQHLFNSIHRAINKCNFLMSMTSDCFKMCFSNNKMPQIPIDKFYNIFYSPPK